MRASTRVVCIRGAAVLTCAYGLIKAISMRELRRWSRTCALAFLPTASTQSQSSHTHSVHNLLTFAQCYVDCGTAAAPLQVSCLQHSIQGKEEGRVTCLVLRLATSVLP